jgi:hypothetical protein
VVSTYCNPFRGYQHSKICAGTFNTVHFQKLLKFDELDDAAYANVKGNVSAMVQIGSVGGALLAFILADRIGRLWATRQL